MAQRDEFAAQTKLAESERAEYERMLADLNEKLQQTNDAVSIPHCLYVLRFTGVLSVNRIMHSCICLRSSSLIPLLFCIAPRFSSQARYALSQLDERQRIEAELTSRDARNTELKAEVG